MQLFNVLLFWIFFGLICAHFAKKRGRRPQLWFFLGVALGAFGVILLFVLPKPEQKKTFIPFIFKPEPRDHELWFYLDRENASQGPLPFIDLNQAWKEEKLSQQSYVWSEGMEEWKKLSELPEVFEDLTNSLSSRQESSL